MKFAGARNMAISKIQKERHPLDDHSLTMGKFPQNKT